MSAVIHQQTCFVSLAKTQAVGYTCKRTFTAPTSQGTRAIQKWVDVASDTE